MQLTVNRRLDKWLGYLLIAALLPVTRLLGILLRRDHGINKAPRQILFIKLMGLGSLVVASDAIKAMRQQYPGTGFILLTDQNIAEGIAPFGVFDEIWAVDTSRIAVTLRDALRFLYRCWRLRNLWVADLEVYSKLTTVYALLTLARNRFGFYLRPVFFRRYLNTHNVLFNRRGFLEDNYWKMRQAITGVHQAPAVMSPVRDAEYRKSYILVNNTCSDLAPTRKLPDETVAAICTWILAHTSYRVAFLGMEKDKAAIDDLIDAAFHHKKDQLVNLAGAFEFNSYYRFMVNEGVCLVTIDSGPLHMARKLGLPTVSIWGPTDPANYLKVQAGDERRHVYEYLKTPCSPCVHHHEKLPCGGNNHCMKDITATSVIVQLSELLDHLESTSSTRKV